MFWLGSVFAPGAVLLHKNPAAASSPGHALNRRSTRLGCDWGLARCFGWGPLSHRGRCSYRKYPQRRVGGACSYMKYP